MTLSLLLAALFSLQASEPAPAPPPEAAAVAPATPAPGPTTKRPDAAAASLAQAVGDARPSGVAPAVDPEEVFKARAVRNLWSLNFKALGPEEWTYLGVYYGARSLFVIILMTLAWMISGYSATALRVALDRVKFDATLTIFLSKLLRWSMLILVGMTCLSYFGVETTGFAAVIGAAGLAIGLAFQGTLSNFAAGAMLLVFRPYKVGDLVNVAGHLGKVCEIELFTTTIDTLDRRRVIVPNSSIYGTIIENVTFHPVRRVDIPVGAAYAADIDATRAALDRAVRSVSLVVADPPPEVVLLELGTSSVNWSVRGYARREQFGDVKQALIRAVKMELDRAGIGIPFPQLDVHFDPPQAA
jgi:small conductance mechanosensitive channel